MNIVYFLKVDELNLYVSVEENIDSKKILPSILETQNTYLVETLGSDFFNHLEDQWIGSTMSTDEQYLLDKYIKPMVAFYTAYRLYDDLNYKATNKSITKESSQFGQPSDFREITYLKNKYLTSAVQKNNLLHKYLCDNSNLFPLWENPTSTEVQPRSWKGYDNGVYFGSVPCRNDLRKYF